MAVLETILLGMAANASYNLTTAAASKAFRAVVARRPDLVAQAETASASGNESDLRSALSSALDVAAGTGAISINGALLEALKKVTFDHQHGSIQIGGTIVSAPILTTGGGTGSTGKTVIGGGTSMRSAGTRIELGQGCQIVMTGNAQIRQS